MRVNRILCIAAGALVIAACGGDDDEATPGDASDDIAETGDGGGDTDGDGGGGDAFGIFTVNGEELRYAMSGLEYSQIEGVDDITFEDCDPSFFGAGFRVIGYPVDDNRELVLAENGDIDGIVDLQLPNDIDDTELMDLDGSFDHGPAGIDTRYRGDDTGQTAYQIDGSRVTGTIVMKNSSQEPTVVDFEIDCG
jgi:hypothetical protein